METDVSIKSILNFEDDIPEGMVVLIRRNEPGGKINIQMMSEEIFRPGHHGSNVWTRGRSFRRGQELALVEQVEYWTEEREFKVV